MTDQELADAGEEELPDLAITWSYSGDTLSSANDTPGDPFADAAAPIRLSRRAFGVFAGLGMYVYRALTHRFDATVRNWYVDPSIASD